MNDLENIITVGWKKGECDFGVRATIMTLTQKQMDELRCMTMVAIGSAEAMYRRANEDRLMQGSAGDD